MRIETSDIRVRTDLTPLNTELLTDLVCWAVQDEGLLNGKYADWGEWDQSVWAKQIRNGVCQTAYCIAGQAVAQSGFVLVYNEHRTGPNTFYGTADYCAPAIKTGVFDDKGHEVLTYDTDATRPIDDTAQRVLGLDDNQGEDCLFNGENTLYQIVSLAGYYMRRRGIEPRFPDAVAAYDTHLTDSEYRDGEVDDEDEDW